MTSPTHDGWVSRSILASLVDRLGLCLLAVFMWRLFFVRGLAIDSLPLAVGLTGIAAGWLGKRSLRTAIDRPLALYTALAIASALYNHGRFVPAFAGALTPGWRPVGQLLIVAIYFYGASLLLSGRSRLAVFIACVVVVVGVLGVQMVYDKARDGFDARLFEFPSVTQWNGYDEIAMVCAMAFPLPLALAAVSGSPTVVIGSAILALVFLLEVGMLFSRAAYGGVAVAYVVLAAVEIWRIKRARLATAGLVALLLLGVGAAGLHPGSWQTVVRVVRGDQYSVDPIGAYRYRMFIWRRAASLIAQHPVLGVGPASYTDAMWKTYPDTKVQPTTQDFRPVQSAYHAHNMILEVAAETGIPAACAFLWIWLQLGVGLGRAATRPDLRIFALCGLGALAAFFAGNLTQQLLAFVTTAERTTFLLWTFIAAAAATISLYRDPAVEA